MQESEQEFSFKNYFIPLTTLKAIHIIVIIGLIVFFNGFFNGFVLDDLQQIVENVSVHSIANIPTFFTGSTFYNGGAVQSAGVYYKPLLSTYFSFLYTIFGANYFVFHVFQLLLHLINTCMLFLLFKRFFTRPLAFFLSLIFLIHPINSETVFYIADAQDILFFFFGILALTSSTTFKSKKYIIFIALLFLLSLLSKETGVAFLGISIVYSFIFNRKHSYSLLVFSISVFALYVFLRITSVGLLSKAASGIVDRLSFGQRLLNIPAIFLFYLKTFFFPLSLSSSYQWAYKQINFTNFFIPLALDMLFIIVVFLVAFMLYKKYAYKYLKIYIFFALWFFAGMLLHLQILPLDVTVAERWFYFPIVGLLGMIGVLLSVYKIKLNNRVVLLCMTILILILSTRTFIRSFDWRNEFVLASHDLSVSNNDNYLENILSVELLKQGRVKEAQIYAEKSVIAFPFYTNINTLGVVYANLGEYQKAKEAYLQALTYGDFYMTYENLGGLTLVYGDQKGNIVQLKNMLKRYPYNAKLWLYLAVLQAKQKNIEDAKIAIRNAYYFDRSYVNAYYYEKIMNNQLIDIKVDSLPI